MPFHRVCGCTGVVGEEVVSSVTFQDRERTWFSNAVDLLRPFSLCPSSIIRCRAALLLHMMSNFERKSMLLLQLCLEFLNSHILSHKISPDCFVRHRCLTIKLSSLSALLRLLIVAYSCQMFQGKKSKDLAHSRLCSISWATMWAAAFAWRVSWLHDNVVFFMNWKAVSFLKSGCGEKRSVVLWLRCFCHLA